MSTNTDSERALKPCPFCGGDATTDRFGHRTNVAAYSVSCRSCHVTTAWCHAETEDAAKSRAIAVWQARAALDKQAGDGGTPTLCRDALKEIDLAMMKPGDPYLKLAAISGIVRHALLLADSPQTSAPFDLAAAVKSAIADVTDEHIADTESDPVEAARNEAYSAGRLGGILALQRAIVAQGPQASAEEVIPRQNWSKEADMVASWTAGEAQASAEDGLSNEDIQALALANGFKLKEQPDGSMALNPYVFDFARAIAAMRQREGK